MLMPAIPNTVLDALGEEAARDLESWLQAHLETIQRGQPPISPLVARQKVNVLMLEQVSNLLRAGEPVLERAADGTVTWRVPVLLTMSQQGVLGQVGEIMVDAVHGSLLYDDAAFARIVAACEQLVSQPPRHRP